MSGNLATIVLEWDGRLLKLRLNYGRELVWLTARPQRKNQAWSKHCAGIDEVPELELAAFLHTAVSEFAREWKLGRDAAAAPVGSHQDDPPLF
jgi:hypothetical protein